MSKTHLPKTHQIQRQWYEIDASKFTLGRLATRAAVILRGKHKADFTPHMDVGDFVVVKNASKVKLTGRKEEQKLYHSYSGYPGGITTKNLKQMMDKKPEWVIEHAVKGMLSKNSLRKAMMRRLKVTAGSEHKFQVDKTIED